MATHWLAEWLSSLELEVDVPFPEGVEPSGGVEALLRYAWDCSRESGRTFSTLHKSSTAEITVRHGWKPALPVFSVEWEQRVEGATRDAFLDMNLRSMAEQAAEWDTTFLGAEYLADHGQPTESDRILQFARLVRWRFRAAPLQDREMLYCVVPYAGPDRVGDDDVADGPLMLVYISVQGPRFPVAAGYSRARNLVPSYDLCRATDERGLHIQHCMTTEIGGGVPYAAWNHVFKSAVLAQNFVEAAHVRDTLRSKCGVSANPSGTASPRPRRRRVVIVGLGDSGVTTAVHMASRDDIEVVGISPVACHYSAQELGGRLAQPRLWQSAYLLPFEAYRMLDGVALVQGIATAVHTDRKAVAIRLPDGRQCEEPYDALLIASGCTNGFWRRPPAFLSREDIEAVLRAEQKQLADATTVAVVGGGPSGVSVAYNLAMRHPAKAVHCFVSGEGVLPGYHPKTVARIEAKLVEGAGVVLHRHHRAVLPDATRRDALGSGPIAWTTGQPSFEADVVVWAVGAGQPNSSFLPPEMLTPEGFVAVDAFLRVAGGDGAVFAVGDIAATDPWRTSARNDGWALVGANIAATLAGEPAKMRAYRPPAYRWGSILGPWDGAGYEVYFQGGGLMWLPLWLWNHFWPLVQRFLFAGMRTTVDWTARASGEAALE